MDSKSYCRSIWRMGWLLIAVTVFNSGCQQAEINTQYGKVSGRQGSDSLNGVSVFADMFAARGFLVKRRQKISPRINRFDTIVWFPNDYSCPSEDAINALDTWLDGDYGRTLIYVGRDYDARGDYYRAILKTAPLNQREELFRRIAESQVENAKRTDGTTMFWRSEYRTECDWFRQVRVGREKTSDVSGELAEGVSDRLPRLEVSTLLEPRDDLDWNNETLLTAAGQEFVSRRVNRYHDFGNSQIVVANGSFLLNYALVESGNRILATNLIDQCDSSGGVLFLESGPMGIDVSDSDTTNHNQWAWIGIPPLRYIVPHFLVWGVLFCFVFFPIFGRPKRLVDRNTSSFRAHVNAIGKLLGRSDQPNRAVEKINDYHRLISGESKRN